MIIQLEVKSDTLKRHIRDLTAQLKICYIASTAKELKECKEELRRIK